MRKIIGGIILAMVFAFLICTTCIVCGWKTGLIAWAIAIILAIIISIAVCLITEGE